MSLRRCTHRYVAALEVLVLARLLDFAGPDAANEQGAEVSDLINHDAGLTHERVSSALHRLSRKGLAHAARWNGQRGESSTWLWYPTRETKDKP